MSAGRSIVSLRRYDSAFRRIVCAICVSGVRKNAEKACLTRERGVNGHRPQLRLG